MPQELVRPVMVDDQDVVAVDEMIPPVAELIATYSVVKIGGRKPNMFECGVGKWLLLP